MSSFAFLENRQEVCFSPLGMCSPSDKPQNSISVNFIIIVIIIIIVFIKHNFSERLLGDRHVLAYLCT